MIPYISLQSFLCIEHEIILLVSVSSWPFWFYYHYSPVLLNWQKVVSIDALATRQCSEIAFLPEVVPRSPRLGHWERDCYLLHPLASMLHPCCIHVVSMLQVHAASCFLQLFFSFFRTPFGPFLHYDVRGALMARGSLGMNGISPGLQGLGGLRIDCIFSTSIDKNNPGHQAGDFRWLWTQSHAKSKRTVRHCESRTCGKLAMRVEMSWALLCTMY